jgi:C-terminal processing protease CtpA/Prc
VKILAAIFIFVAAALACVGHITARTEIRAMAEVCQLIRDNYFKPNEADVREFLRKCQEESIPFTYKRADAIAHINDRLSQIHSSHLTLYSPDENRWLWENEGSDTGVRARMIDGEVVIIGTLEGSPARTAKLQAGDVIVAINGDAPTSVSDVQSTAGYFKIARGPQFFQTQLKLVDLHEDLSPQLVELSPKTGVLRIPSFLPTYFDKDPWLQVASKFSRYQNLIIDLRGNPGGSFPAMLRALSPITCAPKEVGRIWRQPRAGSSPPQELQDDLSADAQLEQVTASDEVILKTFEGYGCFRGRTLILVDQNTSSVSEIFAHAVPKVWGVLTAGQVVMARWFSIASLGGGDYAMSIPIAGFRGADGKEIEREGVRPSKVLSYDLKRAIAGEDNWLSEARAELEKR